MITQEEIIVQIKLDTPTLKTGSDEYGYTELTSNEYETQVLEWAKSRLAKQIQAIAAKQAVTDKAVLLAKLNITADEAKLLLS